MVKRVSRRKQRVTRRKQRVTRMKQRGGTMSKVEFKRAVFSEIKGKNDFKGGIDTHDDHVISMAADAAYSVISK
jgi:5-enolpyruvylshikimate-3-phosphate synthase